MASEGQRTLLGFDFGTSYIGIATGQEITGTASPLKAIKAKDGIPNWGDLEKIIKEWQPDLLVIGLPLNMDGTEQPITARARKFANRLTGRFGIKAELQDERLTTADAKAQLFAQGGYRNLQKDNIDCQSAVLILESYMESLYS
ncbi:Holliday junction resolvase RuvX [Thalassomonas sp. M1454]|uniref:Holliday junction resolvase RuvX n=1 Tax=Thalassomonas sp. M1454 TaxID=2594477 RepID=UPI0011802FC9|nr:Holliday junction resolvase RuvX [Thalassomonas sp. M1454]TRX54524.1 Holliday junction resolvase RuvX [Thalassomonas sp. M1454]